RLPVSFWQKKHNHWGPMRLDQLKPETPSSGAWERETVRRPCHNGGEGRREQVLTRSLTEGGGLRAMIRFGKTAGKLRGARHRWQRDGQADGRGCPRSHRRWSGWSPGFGRLKPGLQHRCRLLTKPLWPITARHNAGSRPKTA